MTDWPSAYHTGELPQGAGERYAGREAGPLAPEVILRYQLVGIAPGISHNLRFIVRNDGAVFFAANEQRPPDDDAQVFNTDLPPEPNLDIGAGGVARISELLVEVDFFSEAAYVCNPRVRDGALRIVAARRGDAIHEAWYENATNALTDYLDTIHPDVEEPSLADLMKSLLPQRGDPGTE